ncbi:MAG: hypothetical protein HQL15_06150 [Candidatus Omnitrophica bacterium]|nr:hypothetical protein [Candidatus Omnitrophota bacterium]
MILFLFLIFIPRVVLADIFAQPINQAEFNEAIAKDSKNTYYRYGYDYNAYSTASKDYRFDKNGINLGVSRFQFHESFMNLISHSEFTDTEINGMMNNLSRSGIMLWQYSSPSVADLYKHSYTNAYLRLADRYQQYENFENDLNDPLVKLRKQALINCLKNNGPISDMDKAFKMCFDSLTQMGSSLYPYAVLESPGDGNYNVTGTVNVTEEVLRRVNVSQEELLDMERIIPNIYLSKDSVSVKAPDSQSRVLISEYRQEFLFTLQGILTEYKRSKSVSPQQLSKLSVFGLPMTEGQIKNFMLLDDTVSYLAMSKIASELAYLKTIDQYADASDVLDRVMAHPAIHSAYKALLQSSVDYVHKEILNLKAEKARLIQYADTMRAVLGEADKQRILMIENLNKESISNKEKGLFKLTP